MVGTCRFPDLILQVEVEQTSPLLKVTRLETKRGSGSWREPAAPTILSLARLPDTAE